MICTVYERITTSNHFLKYFAYTLGPTMLESLILRKPRMVKYDHQPFTRIHSRATPGYKWSYGAPL